MCGGVCWEGLLELRDVKETSWKGWMSGFVQGRLAIIRFDGFEIGPTEANNEGEEKIPPPGTRPAARPMRGDKPAKLSLLPAASAVISAQQREEPGLHLAGLAAAGRGLRPGGG